MKQRIDPLALSEQLLYAVKLKKEMMELIEGLKMLSLIELKSALNDDAKKKTFWINLYNAYFQILRKRGYIKPHIYSSKLINIAGSRLSLDNIEHGILRKNQYKYSKGYFRNPFARRLIKSLSVEQLDYRIHFALNCGAKSCPPIAFYKDSIIDKQLDLATQSFLEAETRIDRNKNTIYVTTLFNWFAGDFGAKKGIVEIYNKQLNRDISQMRIKYLPYSWEEDLDNFVID